MSSTRRRTPIFDRLDRRAAPSGLAAIPAGTSYASLAPAVGTADLLATAPVETYDVAAGVQGYWGGHPPAPRPPYEAETQPEELISMPIELWRTLIPPRTTWDKALDLILGDPDKIGL